MSTLGETTFFVSGPTGPAMLTIVLRNRNWRTVSCSSTRGRPQTYAASAAAKRLAAVPRSDAEAPSSRSAYAQASRCTRDSNPRRPGAEAPYTQSGSRSRRNPSARKSGAMRLKPGRPDLSPYADLFDVPRAARGDLSVTFAGVSTLLLNDGSSAVLTDGFFSRPSLLEVGLRRIAPDPSRIDAALRRLAPSQVVAVVPVHGHFDHAMDAGLVARRTGATLVGSASAAQVGRGAGLPEDRLDVVTPGEPTAYGAWRLTFVESAHCPPDRFPGTIDEPVRPPVRASAYRCGEAWSILVAHDSGRRALVQGSAGFVPGALEGHAAEAAYLGIGQLGVLDESYLVDYWTHTVRAVGARRVVLTHWDDFFRPLDKPLRALPYAGDDLDVTLRVLRRLAAEDEVRLHLPTVWEREDPWSGL